MHQHIAHLQNVITSWPGMTAQPHRFGGIEFNLGSVEVGHVHFNGMVDIPFNSKLRNQLIAEQRAVPHHLLKDTGWISFYIREAADVERALWLFRLSYLFNAGRGSSRAALADVVDIPAAFDQLEPTPALRGIFDKLTTRR
ncbi:MAG: DUF5519 family protein [Anaerolineae bacterium]|nr:DUF5519 family protein [Anaerolineae bacterium]